MSEVRDSMRESALVDAVHDTWAVVDSRENVCGADALAVTCDPAEIATHEAVQSAVHAIWWAWDDAD